MFLNYLKVAVRSLKRYKGHSFINIIGLSIGIAACLLLFLWVVDELSYDRYHENAERIYRVIQRCEVNNKEELHATTQAPLTPALINEFPWIQKIVRFTKRNFLIKCRETSFFNDIFFTDPEVFEVFSFPLVQGDPKTALSEPNTILISEAICKRFWPNENPIGKTINISESRNMKITGIFKNIPRNSHFCFDFLGSLSTYSLDYLNQWGIYNYYTYILVEKNAPLKTFEKSMPEFVEKHMGKKIQELIKMTYHLQPLTDIHLRADQLNEIEPSRDIKTVYIFSVITLFILLIACLNYINLATARFSSRAKEVSLRKVLGATSAQLLKQFLMESLLFAAIALPIAMILAKLFLPVFNELAGKALVLSYFDNIYILAGLVGIIFAVGLLSGLVPAIFITAFHPTSIIKGSLKTGNLIPVLRKYLVVFQFTITILFILCTLIISQQLHYMRTTDLGLDKNNVVNIPINFQKEIYSKVDIIKSEYSKNPNIISTGASAFFPGKPRWNNNYLHEDMERNSYPSIGCIPVDHDFLENFKIHLLEGRNFSRHFPTDEKSAFIINKAAAKKFGWQPAEAIGKTFSISGDWKKGAIIGVVRDFHFNSLRKEVEPIVLYLDPESYEYISVRIKPGHIPETLKFLENKWQEIVPEQPFKYSFLDEDYNRLYKDEFKLQRIFLVITILAILIACLGLWGLVSFTVEQRTKEIGIRRVLGASVTRIAVMLSRDLTLWVLVANILAWPIAWYAMHKWLQDFANRVTIMPWIFLLAGLSVVIIALLTMGYKTIRAATANPVNSLRYE